MEENYLTEVLEKLHQASFPQEVFIKRETLDKESVKFLANTFWNIDAANEILKYVKQKQQELYQYSLKMGYIDESMTFEEFIK